MSRNSGSLKLLEPSGRIQGLHYLCVLLFENDNKNFVLEWYLSPRKNSLPAQIQGDYFGFNIAEPEY